MNLLKWYSRLITVIVVLFFLPSCSKDNAPPPKPPPPIDTLTAGWQKITINEAQGLLDIFFVNNNIGWVCGGNYMGKSIDWWSLPGLNSRSRPKTLIYLTCFSCTKQMACRHEKLYLIQRTVWLGKNHIIG